MKDFLTTLLILGGLTMFPQTVHAAKKPVKVSAEQQIDKQYVVTLLTMRGYENTDCTDADFPDIAHNFSVALNDLGNMYNDLPTTSVDWWKDTFKSINLITESNSAIAKQAECQRDATDGKNKSAKM
jgi:hypothetical protein